ncbi:MAG: hypothetical protein DWG76_03045 [Chloroflexi bacterium]|nr:hypothetical protein [Chloroflexota bacterium]
MPYHLATPALWGILPWGWSAGQGQRGGFEMMDLSSEKLLKNTPAGEEWPAGKEKQGCSRRRIALHNYSNKICMICK